MMLAIAAVGWALLLAAVAYIGAQGVVMGRVLAERDAAQGDERDVRERVIDWLHDARTDERNRAAVELDRVHAEHAKALGTQWQAFATTIEQMLNVTTFGSKQPGEAVRVEREPDAQDRIEATIREDTVAAGAARLQAEYKAAGIDVTLDDCRHEAASMLLGIAPREAGLPPAAADRVAVLARD